MGMHELVSTCSTGAEHAQTHKHSHESISSTGRIGADTCVSTCWGAMSGQREICQGEYNYHGVMVRRVLGHVKISTTTHTIGQELELQGIWG